MSLFYDVRRLRKAPQISVIAECGFCQAWLWRIRKRHPMDAVDQAFGSMSQLVKLFFAQEVVEQGSIIAVCTD